MGTNPPRDDDESNDEQTSDADEPTETTQTKLRRISAKAALRASKSVASGAIGGIVVLIFDSAFRPNDLAGTAVLYIIAVLIAILIVTIVNVAVIWVSPDDVTL